jgi:hypothetical protein
MKQNIDKKLTEMRIKPLTKEEREQVWRYILTTMHQPVLASHFSFIDMVKKPFLWAGIVAFVLFGGSVATAYASDNAKPGDLLYSIDRAIEEIQLRLASSEQRTELKLKMVHERLDEIQKILAESDVDEDEQNDEEDQQNQDNEQKETNISVNTSSSAGDKKRVEQAFDTSLDFIASIRESLLADGNVEAVAALDAIVGDIDTEIDGLPSKWKFDIKSKKDKHKLTLDIRSSDGKQKLKIKTNGDKIDIDYKDDDGKSKLKVKKDGDVKFKQKDKGKKSDDGDDEDEEEEEEEEEEEQNQDTTDPVVATFSPADDATDVAPETNLVITFSENVVAGLGNITIKKSSDDSVVETIAVASVAGLGTGTITVDPALDLENDTEYYVQIDATALEDEAGNPYEGIGNTTAWSFTTITAP